MTHGCLCRNCRCQNRIKNRSSRDQRDVAAIATAATIEIGSRITGSGIRDVGVLAAAATDEMDQGIPARRATDKRQGGLEP